MKLCTLFQGWLSKRKQQGGTDHPRSGMHESLKEVVVERKRKDPLAGAKMGSWELNRWLYDIIKDKRGANVNSYLAILGALGGYACQMSARWQVARSPSRPTSIDEADLVTVTDQNGKKCFFGNALNEPLAESKYSIWSLTAGACNHLGKPTPAIDEMFKYVTESVGTERFGIPRIPDDHRPGDLPIDSLKFYWPKILFFLDIYCDNPMEFPALFAFAIQSTILESKDVIDPTLAATIVMECAIPMSKVDLESIST